MMAWSRVRWKAFWISLAAGLCFLLLMDSCMQFRMSKSEIADFFKDKEQKGTLHQYDAGKRVMNYLHVGEKDQPVVIFVHGSPGSLSAFIDFMDDTLLVNHSQLISVDRPGFGASNFGYAEKTLTGQSQLLFPVLKKYKTDKPLILVGHSLGGPIIAQMAMDYPEMIDGLIIVAGSIDPELEPHEWFRGPLATPFLKWMLPRSIRASNDEIYQVKPQLEEMLPRWKDIRVPVTVIQGARDVLVPPENADFAKKMMINTTVKVIMMEDMNHFVPWSHPHLIRQEIRDMLELLSNHPVHPVVDTLLSK
jgi:pimeloyl-ACP methyl ester carboxylesterase